jgi:transcriptional regulator with XRE-family HTH domain
LTQGEVAQRLVTYASFISKVEAGERRIDVIELAALCRVYGIDFVAFLREVGLSEDRGDEGGEGE